MKKIICFLIAVMTMSFTAAANPNVTSNDSNQSKRASITINNKSDYSVTVKIMRSSGGLYDVAYVSSRSSTTVYFSKSGDFYTKTKAEKRGDVIYKMGGGFSVICNDEGYSEGQLDIYVSSYGSSGKNISSSEFERNDR